VNPMSIPEIPQTPPFIPADRSAATGRWTDPGLVVAGVRGGMAQTATYLTGALVADAAAINPLLAELFRTSQPIVISGTVGFPLLAVGLAHSAGKLWRARRAADRRANGTLLGALTVIWLAFGGALCAVRLEFTPASGGAPGGTNFPIPGVAIPAAGLNPSLASALIFAVLYLASGALATASSYTYNPEARVHNAAKKAHLAALAAQEQALARLARAQQAHQALLAEKADSDARHAAQRRKVIHEIGLLRTHARLRMSAAVGSPRMTSAAFPQPPHRPAPADR
jgi:hypothetical protein